MTDTEILLLETTSHEEKLTAAKRVIDTYELPLIQEEILKAFEKVRKDDVGDVHRYYYLRTKFLFETLLDNNKDMYIAVIKTLIYGKIFNQRCITVLVLGEISHLQIGSSFHYSYCESTACIYAELLHHHKFKIDDLVIPEYNKLEIQREYNERYGGKLTKGAIKNAN